MGSLHLSRRRFATGTAAAFAGIGLVKSPAKAAQFLIRCGSIEATGDPSTNFTAQMLSAIERESGGRIHTEFFPNASLGGDQAELTQLRAGAIGMLATTAGNLSSVIPSYDILPLGFAFNDADQGCRTCDGPVGDYIRNETTAKGLHTLRTFWDLGMFQIGSDTKPIRTPDDLKGFKLRVTSSKITVDMFKELGAIGVPLSGIEVYSSLQTHLIDGEASPLVVIENFRFHELNKYIALTNHAWAAIILIMNADLWNSLPPDLQSLVERNNTKYGKLQRDDAKKGLSALTKQLRDQGEIFNTVDQSLFRAKLGNYYKTWQSNFGPTAWGLLKDAVGKNLP